MAAVVIEIAENGDFYIRHVHCDSLTGEFYDLDKLYSLDSVIENQRVEALVAGDIHAEFIDPDVENATYTASDSIANILKPKYMVFHDIYDFYARNHHHTGNSLLNTGKHLFGRNNVEEGLQQAADFIDRVSREDAENVIVKSNHDEAFDRWLKEADGKHDYENSRFYHYMKYHQLKNLKMNDTGFSSIDPFEFWCKNPEAQRGLENVDKTIFLKRDESLTVQNVEIGFHGDVGINGARGDIRSLARLATKVIIGHSHSPGIHESCYQVGVSARLNLEYKRGPSSWMHTHVIIYPDGKRTLINVINGKWKI